MKTESQKKQAGWPGGIAVLFAGIALLAETLEFKFFREPPIHGSLALDIVLFVPYLAIILLYFLDYVRAATAFGLCLGGFFGGLYVIALTQRSPEDPAILWKLQLLGAFIYLALGIASLIAYHRLPNKRWLLLLCGALPTAAYFFAIWGNY